VDKKLPIRMHSTVYMFLEPDRNLKYKLFSSFANGNIKRVIFAVTVHPLLTAFVLLALCTFIYYSRALCCCRRRSTPDAKNATASQLI
jgi:hypothetical protein